MWTVKITFNAVYGNCYWKFLKPFSLQFERGSATNYITRNRARKKLQLSLPDFRYHTAQVFFFLFFVNNTFFFFFTTDLDVFFNTRYLLNYFWTATELECVILWFNFQRLFINVPAPLCLHITLWLSIVIIKVNLFGAVS